MDRSKSDSLHGRFLKAFTLLELIVVIAIISVLMLIAVPNTIAYLRDSKVTAANTQAQEVYNAVQEYLISQQIRGEKAFGYTGSDDVIYIGAVTTGGQNSNATFGGSGFTSDNASKAIKGITGDTTGSTKIGYLSNGFEGAWLVAVYPKTYTVKFALFCSEYNNAAEAADKLTVLSDMYTTSDLYTSLGDQDDDANTPASDKRYVGQYPYIV